MDWRMSPDERRVLGVLIEKSLAQPEYYPMTLNAITVACNQKNNRNPLMELDDDTVWQSLQSLKERGLVARILPSPGSRVDRFKHEAERVLQWQTPQRAVMAELLLRGPQTPGELRTHCARLASLESLEAVSAVLDSLAKWDPPMVTVLPRGAGQSAIRYAHCLYLDGEVAAEPAPSAATPPSARPTPPREPDEFRRELAALRAEIEDLKRRVAQLGG